MVCSMFFRHLRSSFLLGIALLSFAGCGSLAQQNSTSSTTSRAVTTSAQSNMDNIASTGTTITVNLVTQSTLQGNTIAFIPASIAMLPGTTVIWHNMTNLDETLLSPMSGVFTAASKIIKHGSLKMTFSTVEAISYFSKEYPTVKATLLVQSPTTLVDVKVMKQQGKSSTYALSPAAIVIKSGTTVNWSNETDTNHMLTSDKLHVFTSSSSIARNGSYKMVFSIPGTYHYYSKLFPETRGVIVVVP